MKFLLILAIGLASVTSTSALFLPIMLAPDCMPFGIRNSTTQMCDCPPGQIGDGSLCCVDAAEDLCTEKGDPVTTSVFHQKFWADFPCAYELGTIEESFTDTRVCKISVVVAGKIVHRGAIYSNHFLLRIETKALNGLAVQTQGIKIWGHWFHNPLTNADVDIQVAGPQSLLFDENEFNIAYSGSARVWTIHGCGSVITLRAVKGMDALQIKTPGVCIAAKRKQFQGDVCTKGGDYTPDPFATQSERLLRDLIIERAANNFRDVEDADIRPVCDDIGSEFKKCSGADQPYAMQTCGLILLSGIRRLCLSIEKSDPLVVFRDCISALCGKNREACDRLKNDSGVTTCFRYASRRCDGWVAR